MFRQMRRIRQQLTREETEQILREGTSGVLAVLGDGGYPYAVPLSYCYENGRIWFHGAKTGHKIEAVRSYDKASFCVIGQDEVVPERYTTRYRSAIVFGRIREVTDDAEKWAAAAMLGDKYYPGAAREYRDAEIRREWPPLVVMVLEIEHMTGKEAIELVREKEKAETD